MMMESELVLTFRDLLAGQPVIAEQLRAFRDPRKAAHFLAQIGAMNGIATSDVEILRHVERLCEPQAGRMTKLQLDGVIGGSQEYSNLWCETLRRVLL